jgi:hypothetical protein
MVQSIMAWNRLIRQTALSAFSFLFASESSRGAKLDLDSHDFFAFA